jgi:hypothetical protein
MGQGLDEMREMRFDVPLGDIETVGQLSDAPAPLA